MDSSSDKSLGGVAPPKLLPPHLLVLSLALMLLLSWLLPAALVLPKPWPLLGLLPLVAGFAIAIQGSRQFGQVGTNIVPFTPATELVKQGVFRLSRNPMYLGMVLFLAGVALLLNHMALWLVVAAFTAWIRIGFIAKEEIQMQRTFGEEYRQYCLAVRRWL